MKEAHTPNLGEAEWAAAPMTLQYYSHCMPEAIDKQPRRTDKDAAETHTPVDSA
jgi:hypothetical protein